MRHFQESEDEKMDKGHWMLLALTLAGACMWFWQYGQVYKQQVAYEAQIRSIKHDLSMCQNPEKYFQEEW